MTRPSSVRASWAAVALGSCLAVGGCADPDQAPDAADGAAPGTAATTSAGPAVTAVQVESSGGLAGIDESVRVTADSPGSAAVIEQAAEVAAVADPDGQPGGTPPCCDQISYRVTISLADGSTVERSTYDGADSPVLDLVRTVMAQAAPPSH